MSKPIWLLSVLTAVWLPTPTPMPTSPPPRTPVPVVHKIKADGKRLYDSVTGRTFTPRGANYVRLAKSSTGVVHHSTFEPGKYNAAAARAFLTSLRQNRYNTVRVFIDSGEPAGGHGIGRGDGTDDLVYGPYLDNVAVFVKQAAALGIYVMPTFEWFPHNDYYWDLAGRINGADGGINIAGFNSYTMEKGRAAAKADYLKNFATALKERIGGTNAILAYQTDNELYFEADKAPFDKRGGTVKPLDGVTYDMSKAASRQQAADASLVEYSRRVKAGLLEADPDALMTIGFFTNNAVGKTGFNGLITAAGAHPWVPGRASALSRYGAADFIDVHVYPASAAAVAGELASIEAPLFAKPYVIGEFGARKSHFGGNITKAAYAMRDTQQATCQKGASGWLFWTWDTYENLASQNLFFKLTEKSGAINGQLAPIVRPDPCT